MKRYLLAALVALSIFTGCASVSQQPSGGVASAGPVMTDEEMICAEAHAWVDSAGQDLNAQVLDKKFSLGVDDCTFVQSVSLGYAVYFIDGFDRATGVYLGRMVRVLLFEKVRGRWAVAGDGNVAFMPTPEQRLPPQRQAEKPIEL